MKLLQADIKKEILSPIIKGTVKYTVKYLIKFKVYEEPNKNLIEKSIEYKEKMHIFNYLDDLMKFCKENNLEIKYMIYSVNSGMGIESSVYLLEDPEEEVEYDQTGMY